MPSIYNANVSRERMRSRITKMGLGAEVPCPPKAVRGACDFAPLCPILPLRPHPSERSRSFELSAFAMLASHQRAGAALQ